MELKKNHAYFYCYTVERPNLPEEYEQDAWNRLKRAISSIKQNEAQHDSLEVLYQVN
jgi:hypothetical protein